MSRPNDLIQFYLTNICNSKCQTCNIWKNKCMQELPVEKVKQVISEFPDADYVFGGGEFTLYKQRNELLDWCDKKGVKYTVLSNVVNLTLLEQLLASHDIKNLTISCDGKRHDEIRGVKGNLKNIEKIITAWRGYIPNIKLSYTLSRLNEYSIDEDMEYFKSLGFKKIYFCIAQNMDLLKVGRNEIVPSNRAVEKLYKEYSDMLYDKDLQLLEDMLHGKMKVCDSTDSVHTIYTNGDVVTCQSYLSKDVLGNIYEESFGRILEKNDVWPDEWVCPHSDYCHLVCQRRYDYEDRV